MPQSTVTPERLYTEQQMKEIAGAAWQLAANAFRVYPDNKHTFVAVSEFLYNKHLRPPSPTKFIDLPSVTEVLEFAKKKEQQPSDKMIYHFLPSELMEVIKFAQTEVE